MLSCCLKCRENTESKNPKLCKAKSGRIMLLSKCAECDSKKTKFSKDQEASELLNLNLKSHVDHLQKQRKNTKQLKKQEIHNFTRDFKDLTRRTTSDKMFRDKAFNIAKNPKYDEYQRGFASMVYNVFIKTFQWCCYTCSARDLSYTSCAI